MVLDTLQKFINFINKLSFTKLMLFHHLASILEQLEHASSGNTMREILSSFLKKVPQEDIDKVCHLTLGTIASPYENVVLGMADQMVIRAIAAATSIKEETIKSDFKKYGDLGIIAEKEVKNKTSRLIVSQVFNQLHAIAQLSGTGSQDKKIQTLSSLIKSAVPIEAKYITRIALGTLRIGVGEMTLIDSLAIAFTGDKKNKPLLEKAYNVCPDVGIIAKAVATKKLEGIRHISPAIGRPIKVMLAQRAKTMEEIQVRMPEGIVAEEKYDGERIQIHKKKSKISFFSRRMDDITAQYPDLGEEIKKIERDFIAEGEIIPIDKSGNLLDFQTLMQRRRKNDIAAFAQQIPVVIFFFDLLYQNNKNYLNEPYHKRQRALHQLFNEGKKLKFARHIITKDINKVEKFFNECLKRGTEGIIAKNVNGVYQAGTRDYNWIKWKKEYAKELRDTFDLVVVGAFAGKGRRSSVYGALLCACYNKRNDTFETFCKVGSGFTDQQLEELPKLLKKYQSKSKPARLKVHTNMEPDVWFQPELVVEVTGADTTRSPSHTAAERDGKGLALRFPRFIQYRPDKKAEQATTSEEIRKMA